MKSRLCLVCGAFAGITILHCTALAEAATAAVPAAGSASPKTNGQDLRNQGSRSIEEQCEEEWKAGKEAMMKSDMTEDRYVEQCRVKDDVPVVPPENAAPPAAPNRPPDR